MAHGGNGTSVAFGQTLQRLKQQGCNLLVVGSVPDPVLTLASNQMLGDPNLRRYRLFVLTDADVSTAHRRLPATSTRSVSETASIISHVPSARTATAHTATVPDRVPEVQVYENDLEALRETVGDVISTFERQEGSFDSGQFRLCFDSLRPLLDEYGREEVFGFLNRLTADVRGVKGMGHFILPVDRENDSIEEFAPVFDAIVELRTVNDSREQERWHLPGHDLTTDWIPL